MKNRFLRQSTVWPQLVVSKTRNLFWQVWTTWVHYICPLCYHNPLLILHGVFIFTTQVLILEGSKWQFAHLLPYYQKNFNIIEPWALKKLRTLHLLNCGHWAGWFAPSMNFLSACWPRVGCHWCETYLSFIRPFDLKLPQLRFYCKA